MGNFLLFITVIFMAGLLYYTAAPAPRGDYGVGYSLMLLIFGGGFFIFSGLLTWNLAATQRLDWLPAPGGFRNGLILFGWLAFALTVLFGSLFKSEWHPGELPQFLRWLALAQVSFWLPLLMLAPVLWLNSPEKSGETIPPALVQLPVKIGFGISCMMAAGLLMGMLGIRFGNGVKAEPLEQVLRLTAAVQDSAVRQAALADLKSRPGWEDQVYHLANDRDACSTVYLFLECNRVPHPERYVEPIKQDLRRRAAEIRKRLQKDGFTEEWCFDAYRIKECLGAIDFQFSTVEGGDFRAEVRELRDALDTKQSASAHNVQFRLTPVVEEWLKKHE